MPKESAEADRELWARSSRFAMVASKCFLRDALFETTVVVKLFKKFRFLSVTYHAYYYGCDDANISVWPEVPAPIPIWETILVQLYWKSTNIINSTELILS